MSKLSVNTLYNLGGIIAPTAVTVITIPWYLHTIGEARFGILSLLWIVFGYFGLFDFGLSRATTNRLAQLRGDPRERNAVFFTALASNAFLGLVAGLLFFAAAFSATRLGMFGHSTLIAEIPAALPWMAAFIPLSLVSGVFTGTLEADERFTTLNIQQVVGAVLLQTMPLAASLLLSPQVQFAVVGAVSARLIAVVWNAISALSTLRGSGAPAPRKELVWPLFRYGMNVAVTNIISPILVSADQFLIAMVLGAKSVAYYAVPFNIAMKGTTLAAALSRALFPRLSSLGEAEATSITLRASETLANVSVLFYAPAIILAKPFLVLWLGAPFAAQAAPVAQLLLLATWVNGVAFVPFAFLQACGRPHITARFHAIELIPFLCILWFLLHAYGLCGAALAWLLRVLTDALLLYWAMRVHFSQLLRLLPPALLLVAVYFFVDWVRLDGWSAATGALITAGSAGWYVGTRDLEIQKLIAKTLGKVRQVKGLR